MIIKWKEMLPILEDFKGALQYVGYHVFYNCSSLTSITILDSVTSIGSDAFKGCSSLTI